MTEDRLNYWFGQSRTFAVVDATRSRLTAAVHQSRFLTVARARLDEWRGLDWPSRYLSGGSILVTAAAAHTLLLWATGGVIGWVILIIPALAALIGGLAMALALTKKDHLPD